MVADDALMLNAFLGAALRACSASLECERAPACSRARAAHAREEAAGDAEVYLRSLSVAGVFEPEAANGMAVQMLEMLRAGRAGWSRLDCLTRNAVRCWSQACLPSAGQ